MYEIKVHPKIAKYLHKLPQPVSERIKEKLKSIRSDPFNYLEHYEGADVYKLRIGDYRALIDVDKKSKTLYVQVLDKRERIYKRVK